MSSLVSRVRYSVVPQNVNLFISSLVSRASYRYSVVPQNDDDQADDDDDLLMAAEGVRHGPTKDQRGLNEEVSLGRISLSPMLSQLFFLQTSYKLVLSSGQHIFYEKNYLFLSEN